MPTITRSKRQKRMGSLSRREQASSHGSSSQPFNESNEGSPAAVSGIFIKDPITPHESHKVKSVLSSPHDTEDRSCKYQSHPTRKPPQGISESFPSGHFDSVITHQACQTDCTCEEGAFQYPADSCVTCGHTMDQHTEIMHPWSYGCDYVCERPELVDLIIERVQLTRVVVIRATPQVGKTTLLKLLGRRILENHNDLEPVFVYWRPKDERKGLRYEQYLHQELSYGQTKNEKCRPCNPRARPIYLIDEAQNSYDEPEFWADALKGHNTRSRPLFVLVCLYGAVEVSRIPLGRDQSQALRIDLFQRVELRPSLPGSLSMLFKPQETANTALKWAISNNFLIEENVPEYLHIATDGHPGMVGLILAHFATIFPELPKEIQLSRKWSTMLCHELLVLREELLEWISTWGRGLWTAAAERYTFQMISHPQSEYFGLSLSDVKDALREVAIKPHGYTRVDDDFDALTYCHKMGFLHTEKPWPSSKETTYFFASPIHRRVAYRRLCAGLEPETHSDRSLQETCLNAIERLSPSALRNRCPEASVTGAIPVAAFQDEMHCCLNYELHNLPILSEYSHTKDGRIDFYIYDKKWAIELLRCGSDTDIKEHASRFATGGKYAAWNIFEDYIILNFCTKTTIRDIGLLDSDVKARIVQVVVDPENCLAEVYTHDKQLQARFALGENRKRFQPHDLALEKTLLRQRREAIQRELQRLEEAEEAAAAAEAEKALKKAEEIQ